MGLGGTIKLTTTTSGPVMCCVTFNMTCDNPGVAYGGQVRLRYGTGTAPTNAAVVTGTILGSLMEYTTFANTNDKIPVTLFGIVQGLSPATAYWFDVELISIAGIATISITDVYGHAIEFGYNL